MTSEVIFTTLSSEAIVFIKAALIIGPITIVILLIYIARRKEKEPDRFRW